MRIRKRDGNVWEKRLLNIRVLFILATCAEIMFTVLISSVLAWSLRSVDETGVVENPIVQVLLFSIIIGLSAAVLVNYLLLRPVVRLDDAMRRVADGDFSIQIQKSSRIREVRQLYRSFNLMTKELQATETLQSDFVSNVSHEFKTPINAIEGYATLLQGGSDSLQQQEYIDRILANTHRLSSLVGNILLLSKVSSHAIPMNETSFRLDEQIRQALLLMEPAWSQKQTEFDVDLEEITWYGPESLLYHVWSNLIANAIKFGPQDSLITMRLKQTDGRYVFTIDDRGPGIPDAELKRIFNRFYQLDNSHRQEGNGLGLALCRQIVTICGGEISVENRPRGGCRFLVSLPIEREND